MRFQGREIPEADFQRLAREAFRAQLEEMRQQAEDAKGLKWYKPSQTQEQAQFEEWLRQIGVGPFPLYPSARGGGAPGSPRAP